MKVCLFHKCYYELLQSVSNNEKSDIDTNERHINNREQLLAKINHIDDQIKRVESRMYNHSHYNTVKSFIDKQREP